MAQMVAYEIAYKPEGTLVNYSDGEIRVLCPEDTKWNIQQSGANADPNSYYIGFKAYAPMKDVVGFKEDLGEMITDTTMYSFKDNDFAGIDEYGISSVKRVGIIVTHVDDLTAVLFNDPVGEINDLLSVYSTHGVCDASV